jgi:DNA-binding PadR family transcriptional regulator
MRNRHKDFGFGAWADFCGPSTGFRGRRHRGRMFDRGDLRYMILTLLAEQPMHGYEVMQALSREAAGLYTPSAGSVYPVLQLLQDQGYVTSDERDGKRVYSITDAGREFLKENSDRVDDVFDRISDYTSRFRGSEMRDLTRSFIKFAQVSFEEAVRGAGDTQKLDELKDILERATREMEDAMAGRRGGKQPDEA